MYLHTQLLINDILPDEPDPAAANALQEGLGGQFGEMRTMMQNLFQSMNFRGDPSSKPYKDLLQGVGTEEISHVELIGTTIARLLDGSPNYQGKKNDPVDKPGAKDATPLKIALDTGNIHYCLVAAQGALPVDAAGNPWPRIVCVQQWEPGPRPAVQPDARVDRPAAEHLKHAGPDAPVTLTLHNTDGLPFDLRDNGAVDARPTPCAPATASATSATASAPSAAPLPSHTHAGVHLHGHIPT